MRFCTKCTKMKRSGNGGIFYKMSEIEGSYALETKNLMLRNWNHRRARI
jgi:hypothetical protein